VIQDVGIIAFGAELVKPVLPMGWNQIYSTVFCSDHQIEIVVDNSETFTPYWYGGMDRRSKD
jgi:hypothetical protein